MKLSNFENITRKKLIIQFLSIFLIPYLFIIFTGIVSEFWEMIYFYAKGVVIIAILIAIMQTVLFIKSYAIYKKKKLN